MNTEERNFVIFAAVFAAFGLANAWYLNWLPYGAPPVLLVLSLGIYLIWADRK